MKITALLFPIYLALGLSSCEMLDSVRRQTLLDKVSSDLRDTLAHLG